MATKLRGSITFLPLKDLRYAKTVMDGNTWFMNSLSDIYEEDEVEHLYFPSEASKGRLLCISGRNSHNGGKNLYALAWRDSLPNNARIMGGLTFMSDTYYDYNNLWHGLSAVAPFVGWYQRKGCEKPSRWVLYHRGELRTSWKPPLQK
ncbi:transmembrane protein [Thalictrum thalictroides]|uniref:Transmembrane protein n=1 Tax=Thalictrum thalictroides TaxID=46969 RepID=A0A7J6VAR5_THATH|nr:transmembrane protein [Thalictrum thalictroides]